MSKSIKQLATSATLVVGLVACPVGANDEFSDRLSERDVQRLKAFIGESAAVAEDVVLPDGDGYRVKRGDTLSEIFQRFYSDTNINKEVLQAVFVKTNKTAFRRGNPNWLMAGSVLRFPSGADVINYVVESSNVDESNGVKRDDWVSYP